MNTSLISTLSLSDLFDNFFEEINPTFRKGNIAEVFKSRSMGVSYVKSDETNYYIVCETPGLKKEDIKIELLENNITIKGEVKENEKVVKSFLFTYNLNPKILDFNDVETNYENGILQIKFKKLDLNKIKEKNIKYIEVK